MYASRSKLRYRAAYVDEGSKLIWGPTYETPTYCEMFLQHRSLVNLSVLREKISHTNHRTLGVIRNLQSTWNPIQ